MAITITITIAAVIAFAAVALFVAQVRFTLFLSGVVSDLQISCIAMAKRIAALEATESTRCCRVKATSPDGDPCDVTVYPPECCGSAMNDYASPLERDTFAVIDELEQQSRIVRESVNPPAPSDTAKAMARPASPPPPPKKIPACDSPCSPRLY